MSETNGGAEPQLGGPVGGPTGGDPLNSPDPPGTNSDIGDPNAPSGSDSSGRAG